jgi:hypothetical protein
MNTDTNRELRQQFTSNVESKIGNYHQPQFDPSNPKNIYLETFNDTIDGDFFLPYGDEIQDAILAEIDEQYLEQLDEYIGTKVVIPGTSENIEPVLATIKC